MNIFIVIPVYRSEKILPTLVQAIEAEMKRHSEVSAFELVLVNDASPDGSWEAITSLKSQYSFLTGINLRRNYGQHNAIMAGLKHIAQRATAEDVVVMMDDDMQHSPTYIIQLVRVVRSGKDVCYTNYLGRKHKGWKIWGSKLTNLIAKILINKPEDLYLSSFKAIAGDLCAEISQYNGAYPYIDGLILQATTRIASIDIQHNERLEGQSNYNLLKLTSLFLKMATGFSIIPLRLVTYLGFITFLLGLLQSLWIIVGQFIQPIAVKGWSSSVIIALLLGGIQMLSLGLVGEYVGRMYLRLNEKPQFTIREIV
jgi:undecaprenyl-phosphate 4-deoxy-4-formamido-L-arabinose transferase